MYALLLHSETPLEEIERWLVSKFGAPDERGCMSVGALSVAVDGPSPLGTEEYDEQLDGPVVADIAWFVENRGDHDAYQEAERTVRVTVAELTVAFDASALFLWDRDIVMMSRKNGEMVIYDEFTDWFRPDIEPFLPPHTVSSEHRLA